ncbi:hypothetical protein ATO8_03396 [Roseivivax marinus]|jgi:Flp pilus assembly pilin Flp|uniref:Pilus assembly protein n=1 Tax=Roseivivax marinus TaxID=1379903 RepID=W4HND8_9RHOB|nr:hypothetical protein [Roseivivax marinus]ETW13903.1 hypothetical protein ATO8_03396 [Roseivivax marinus]UMA63819.1 hypothetical protein LVO79_12360 [Roseivivax marinus]SEK88617.1 hypothetical protein SAMN05444413_10483 [Roseivivax marinus]
MKQLFGRIIEDEDGAVTVDWVVLTAAVVGLATAAYVQINQNSVSLIQSASNQVGAEQAKLAAMTGGS